MPSITIFSDNLPDQINGVVTTYDNITQHAVADGYQITHIHPGMFDHVSCPGYPEIKIAFPVRLGQLVDDTCDHFHIATEGPIGWAARYILNSRGYKYTTAYHTKFPEALRQIAKIPLGASWAALRRFHSNSQAVLTTTDSMVDQLAANGISNACAWTRGVDRSIFKPASDRNFRLAKSSGGWQTILLNVGRVSEEKNLEQFYQLDIPNTVKVQVGDGPMLETYRKKYPSVQFVGAKRGHALAEYYKMADVFVFPSRWDTFGLVMIEAFACGTPVAAFPVQGPLDVIQQGVNGVMDDDLAKAVRIAAIQLDRTTVHESSDVWSWALAWSLFKQCLVVK